MKGLELSKRFYEEYGKPMLDEHFRDVLPYIAVGLVGSGSECYGYDDKISRDHDFEPAFCIFIPDENIVDRRTAFQLERAYAKLPKQFMGFERSPVNPVGGSRHGVIRTADFFKNKTGTPDGQLTADGWFMLPEYSLLEATNGEIFTDNYGEVTKIRKSLCYLPEDIRLKKLAGNLLLMGQSGQYNYNRCVERGETAAAQLAAFEFVKSAVNVIFLLNKAYVPYYKWSFRALRNLPVLCGIADDLEYMISSGNSPDEAQQKEALTEKICAAVSDEIRNQGLTKRSGSEAEALAYSVNDKIKDAEIRNLNVLYAV